ncbi:hypothetical protein LZ554_009444 [Drepanopeziza brunnea f. sp. 'monogermtubi']|nr:hypothetical protein LZ554_009444 [Drepanopeziza brunnea f. sp. 'monogermtubi']
MTHAAPLSSASSSNSAFCSTCQTLEMCITTFESQLASGKWSEPMPRGLTPEQNARIGRRSEIKDRAEVQQCPGCQSLLAAWDEYMKTADEIDFDPSLYVGHEKADYDIKLAIKRNDTAWSNPIRIASSFSGIPGLYLEPTLKFPPSYDLGRICDPSRVGISLLKKWISCCEESHDDTCSAAIVSTNLGPATPVNYIDLERSCIVALSEPPQYVALSYVWGQVPTLMTTKSNLEEMRIPDALAKAAEQIPKTIRDAMNLTLAVGVNYLWVDALCIVQDDYETKQDHLRAMPSIYSLAKFTLAIINGLNANAGIQGIGTNPESRSVPPYIRLPTKTVAVKSKSLHKRLKFLNRMGFHSRPIWSRRAWTMQEQMFSKRILLMEGLASWICMRTQFREEIERAVEDVDYAKSNPANQRYRLIHPRNINLKMLGRLVDEYNQRDLSFEEDVSDAFLGISALSVPLFGPIHFGMPEAFFDHAMCWQPSSKLRSRQATNPERKLPSWSWMGWYGELDLSLWEVFQDHILEIFDDMTKSPFLGFDIRIKPLVTWHKICLACNQKFPISNSYHESRGIVEAPAGWTRLDAPPHWPRDVASSYFQRSSEQGAGTFGKLLYRYPIIHPEHDPPHRCRNPVFDTILNVRAQRLFSVVSVSEIRRKEFKWSTEPSIIDAYILDDSGARIGSVSPVDLPLGSSYTDCEFIAISTGTCPSRQADGSKWDQTWASGRGHPFGIDVDGEFAMGERYEFVNVLWIERREGVAYRRTLGRISKRAWERGPREEVDVILG